MTTLHAARPVALYRAIWRWHFYAGLLTLPFLVSLAVTGGIYLFEDELGDAWYGDMLLRPAEAAPHTAPLGPEAMISQAAADASAVVAYVPPSAPERAARVVLASDAGRRAVFVDPYSGAVLGSLAQGEHGNLGVFDLVRRWHSLTLLGWPGNRLIEIVAGWTLILVATGIYLWLPRGRGGALSVRATLRERVFWRDLHAVTGVLAGGLIAFLALTGLPWSGFWGEGLKSYLNEAGMGYPAGFWSPVQASGDMLDAEAHHAHHGPAHADVTVGAVPWALELAPVPASAGGGQPIGVDRAVARFEALGMPAGYTVTLPRGPAGVYSATVLPDRIGGARTVHLDQYSAEVLFDAGYADFGVAARAIELGTSIHTGRQLGRPNQLLMLAACVAIVLMAVSAAVMWWKRRPHGSLGAPRYPQDFRLPRAVLAAALIVGIVFPLVGLSIMVMLAIDRCLPRAWRARLA